MWHWGTRSTEPFFLDGNLLFLTFDLFAHTGILGTLNREFCFTAFVMSVLYIAFQLGDVSALLRRFDLHTFKFTSFGISETIRTC
jgi:hypothetical protein